jgi:hypothetical protein
VKLSVVSRILDAADNINLADIREPESNIKEGEKEVGVLSIDLKKLHGYSFALSEKIKLAKKKYVKKGLHCLSDNLLKENGCSGLEDLLIELEDYERDYSRANDLFWAEVREVYRLKNVETIGIRAGWKVVKIIDKCLACEKKDGCILRSC